MIFGHKSRTRDGNQRRPPGPHQKRRPPQKPPTAQARQFAAPPTKSCRVRGHLPPPNTNNREHKKKSGNTRIAFINGVRQQARARQFWRMNLGT